MKHKIKKTGFVILALVIAAAGLVYIFREKILSNFTPKVEQSGKLKIVLKNDTAFISSNIVVKNRFFIEIKLDSLHYSVELLDKTYVKGERFLGLVLPSFGKDSVDFLLKVPYVTLIKDLKEERKTEDSLVATLNAVVQYATVFGSGEKIIHKVDTIKIPQPPEITLVDIIYEKIQRKEILATAKVKVINHSIYQLNIKEMHYTMDVLEQGNIKGKLKNEVKILPKGHIVVDLPIKIEVKHFVKTIFQVATNKDNYNYTLKISALVESPDVSTESYHLDMVKKGKMELKK